MAFKDYIDKDTRNFLLILAGLAIFMFLIFPRIESQLFTLDISQPLRPLFPEINPTVVVENQQNITLDPNKDYKLNVNTTSGSFVIDLNENVAPKNVSNFISLVPQYKNSNVLVSKDYLFKVDSNADVRYTVEDEINADFLLLDRVKVRDAAYLRDAYIASDPSTSAFAPDNLRKYEDFTVKQFYQEVLGYKYSSNLSTPKAAKYTVYMASTGANQNKVDFFILMDANAPEIDGRFTPVGKVSEGFTVLDAINNATAGTVKVTSITVR
jgi:cyclophilin family peptidyl-prolyl cis-trans isomerase